MANELLDLSLNQKIGQLFFIGISGPDIGEDDRALLEKISPGGVCLFARNIKSRTQTRELLDAIRDISVVEPLLSIDQEGGLVDRLKRIITPMPAANRIRTSDQASKLGEIIGETLQILGFNMDFAPVVDVIDEERSTNVNGLYSRAFGTSADEVSELAGAFLDSLQSAGCLGCLKHFPGLGASNIDSHDDLPEVTISESTLLNKDIAPYTSLLRTTSVAAIMIAHAAYPETNLQETDQNGKLLPSSLSRRMINEFLRGHLGYQGLVITDDLEMGAIVKNWGVAAASKMALYAGADMLAICASPKAISESYNAVLSAVESGEISEGLIDGSLERISAVRSKLQPPPSFSEDRLDELSDQVAELNKTLSCD